MISIIVPVYNVKDYLVRCLESLYAQTYKDYEVIVVDDGSSDESGKIAEEYCRDKPNFHVYHKTNGGLMSAWKYGLEKSKGNYIGFVDSDDYIASTMYEELVNAGFKYDAEIVLCNHYYVNENGTSKILHRNPIKEGFYTGEKLDIIKRKTLPLIGQDYISPSRCNKLIKKNLLQSCLKYTDSRISSAEDVNTIVPCVLKCERFYYVDKALYYYVKRETSISHIFKNHRYDGWLLTLFPYDEKGRTKSKADLKSLVVRDFLPVDFMYDCDGVVTKMELCAGFAGAEENLDTYGLKPSIGWLVREKSGSDHGVQMVTAEELDEILKQER